MGYINGSFFKVSVDVFLLPVCQLKLWALESNSDRNITVRSSSRLDHQEYVYLLFNFNLSALFKQAL